MLLFRVEQIFTDPVFYLFVYAVSKFKRKKEFFMVPIVHDIIQVQALVWVSQPMLIRFVAFVVAATILIVLSGRRKSKAGSKEDIL